MFATAQCDAGNNAETRELMQAHVDIVRATSATLTTGADFKDVLTDLARVQIEKEKANKAKIVSLGRSLGFSLADAREFRANVIHTGDVGQMQWAYAAVTAIRGGQ